VNLYIFSVPKRTVLWGTVLVKLTLNWVLCKLFLFLLSWRCVRNQCRANECHSRKILGYFFDGSFASRHYRPDDDDDDKVDLSFGKQ
jgi:hypothetical protein